MRLAGRVALVAGGAESMGAAVCVADIDKKRADAAAEGAFGHLDLLANLSGTNYRVSFDEQSEEMRRKIIDVNLTADSIGIKAVVPAMRRARRGVMLHVGLLGSIRQGVGKPRLWRQQDRLSGTDAQRRRIVCVRQYPLYLGVIGLHGYEFYPWRFRA